MNLRALSATLSAAALLVCSLTAGAGKPDLIFARPAFDAQSGPIGYVVSEGQSFSVIYAQFVNASRVTIPAGTRVEIEYTVVDQFQSLIDGAVSHTLVFVPAKDMNRSDFEGISNRETPRAPLASESGPVTFKIVNSIDRAAVRYPFVQVRQTLRIPSMGIEANSVSAFQIK